jgi:hypothetical protein
MFLLGSNSTAKNSSNMKHTAMFILLLGGQTPSTFTPVRKLCQHGFINFCPVQEPQDSVGVTLSHSHGHFLLEL